MASELKEYQYTINHQLTTAMLTPKMAERLGATEVGTDPDSLNGGYTQAQNQAVYATSDMNTGVEGDAAVQPIRPQQLGVDNKGRSASARVTVDSLSEKDKLVYLNEETDDDGQRKPKAKASGDADTKARTVRNKSQADG